MPKLVAKLLAKLVDLKLLLRLVDVKLLLELFDAKLVYAKLMMKPLAADQMAPQQLVADLRSGGLVPLT